MSGKSLQWKLDQIGSPVKMLRDSPLKLFQLAYTRQHSNWRDEQAASTKTAVLFDQTNPMNDAYALRHRHQLVQEFRPRQGQAVHGLRS